MQTAFTPTRKTKLLNYDRTYKTFLLGNVFQKFFLLVEIGGKNNSNFEIKFRPIVRHASI